MSSFRDVLILINVIAVAALLIFILVRVVSLRRNPEVKQSQNQTKFFDDAVLEGPHLERVLGVALIALVIAVVALIVYFIWEPFRGADAATQFKDQSKERGAVLFANKDSPEYDATKSLLCADCHGLDGGGGSANFIVKSEDPRCDPQQTVDEKLAAEQPYCLPSQVAWEAPNLQLAGLRYSRAQLTQIITYGRPGTPMPAWGVASGKGVLNPQGIADLVNYVESLATTPDKAQAEAQKQYDAWRKNLNDPEVQAAAAKWLADAKVDLAAAEAQAAATPGNETLNATVVYMQDVLNVAQQWYDTTQNASDGQVLFMANTGCARCHTRGWSYFDPTNPEANPPPGIMGGGAYGPNLTGGDVNAQFPPPTGETDLFGWISVGVPANQQYGIRGISSGRMAHFGAVLTKDQIDMIMAYERSL
jgi:mono/diheme cytochrome c family protein